MRPLFRRALVLAFALATAHCFANDYVLPADTSNPFYTVPSQWHCDYPQDSADRTFLTPWPGEHGFYVPFTGQFFSKQVQFESPIVYTGPETRRYAEGARAVASAISTIVRSRSYQQAFTAGGWIANNYLDTTDPVLLVSRVSRYTNIISGPGTMEQLYRGLCRKDDTYLGCKSFAGVNGSSADGVCYKSEGYMPNVDAKSLVQRVMEGSIFILLTNKMEWNPTTRAYRYGPTRDYMVYGAEDLTSQHFPVLQLKLVETGEASTVPLLNPRIDVEWSTGSVSRGKTVTAFNYTALDSVEVVLGYVGFDPIVDHF